MIRRSRLRSACGAAAMLLIGAQPAIAQPAGSGIWSFNALMATPAGALTPAILSLNDANPAGARRVAMRYSRWALPDRAANNVLGATYYRISPEGQVAALTAGYFRPGCDCPAVAMVGADMESIARDALLESGLRFELNIAAGIGYGRDSDHNYVSASLGVPVGISFDRMNGSRLAAFLLPRGSIASYDGSYDAVPVIGGGISWTGPTGRGVQLTLNRVIVDGSVTNAGVGVSWTLK